MNSTFAEFFITFCENGTSENGTTDEAWQLGEYRTNGIVLAVFRTIFLLIGLPWNLMVIVTVVKEKLYKQPTIILLLNLVFIDLLMLVVVITSDIITGVAGEYIIGDSDAARCRTCYLGFIIIFFSLTSIFTLAMMSLDRFLYFYKPLQYDRIITVPRILVTLLVAWIVNFLISAMPIFGYGEIIFTPQLATCVVHFSSRDFYFHMVLILACPPLVVLILCNIGVVYIVQKSIRAVYTINKTLKGFDKELSEEMKKKRQEKQFHLIGVFAALICFNIVSWLPIMIVSFVSSFTGLETIPTVILIMSGLGFNSQNAIHPILESTFISDVRKPLKNMICYCCLKRKISENP